MRSPRRRRLGTRARKRCQRRRLCFFHDDGRNAPAVATARDAGEPSKAVAGDCARCHGPLPRGSQPAAHNAADGAVRHQLLGALPPPPKSGDDHAPVTDRACAVCVCVYKVLAALGQVFDTNAFQPLSRVPPPSAELWCGGCFVGSNNVLLWSHAGRGYVYTAGEARRPRSVSNTDASSFALKPVLVLERKSTGTDPARVRRRDRGGRHRQASRRRRRAAVSPAPWPGAGRERATAWEKK